MKRRKYPFIVIAALALLTVGALFTPIQESNAVMNTPRNIVNDSPNLAYGGRGMGQYFAGTMHDFIAAELGMTSEELWEACLAGKTWAELAVEKGMDLDELENKIVENRKAQLGELVKEGRIPQAQMDYMLGNMQKNIEESITNGTFPRMRGQGRGNMGGNCRGQGYRW